MFLPIICSFDLIVLMEYCDPSKRSVPSAAVKAFDLIVLMEYCDFSLLKLEASGDPRSFDLIVLMEYCDSKVGTADETTQNMLLI